MKTQSLAEQYKQFMKRQNIDGMDAQRKADVRFLQLIMPTMRYSPVKLAQVIQKYSQNRVISHYGKKLVKEVSLQPQCLKGKEKKINQQYPRTALCKHFRM